MATIFEQVGEKITSWLREHNYTQNDLAERLGVSKQVMSKILLGKKSINIKEIQQIAEVMNMPIDQLIGTPIRSNGIQDPVMFMIGNLKNDKTKEKLQFLDHVMDELIELEKLTEIQSQGE
jgi:transcriptional regulator with XRE-family HTH domain